MVYSQVVRKMSETLTRRERRGMFPGYGGFFRH